MKKDKSAVDRTLKIYYNMSDFSIKLIALGVEISITLYILAIWIFTSFQNFQNTYDAYQFACILANSAQKVFFVSIIVALVSDIVNKYTNKHEGK